MVSKYLSLMLFITRWGNVWVICYLGITSNQINYWLYLGIMFLRVMNYVLVPPYLNKHHSQLVDAIIIMQAFAYSRMINIQHLCSITWYKSIDILLLKFTCISFVIQDVLGKALNFSGPWFRTDFNNAADIWVDYFIACSQGPVAH